MNKTICIGLFVFLVLIPGIQAQEKPSAEKSDTLFQKYDVNSDGKISIKEYSGPIHRFLFMDMNEDMTLEKWEAELTSLRWKKQVYDYVISKDKNASGALCISELPISATRFAMLDSNGNEQLDIDELTAGLRRLSRGSSASAALIRFTTDEVLKDFEAYGGRAEWKVVDNELIGISRRGDGSRFTYKTYYSSIKLVRIRGRIVPPAKNNFRIAVGPINMILNWECADENGFHDGRKGGSVKGHALTPGKMHTIVVAQKGKEAIVSIDGKEIYRSEAKLEGTVTVYPALGSTIAISDIDIDGTPVPGRNVFRHSHNNTH
jgi:Ca2+-binding EF-hand superfamily protein